MYKWLFLYRDLTALYEGGFLMPKRRWYDVEKAVKVKSVRLKVKREFYDKTDSLKLKKVGDELTVSPDRAEKPIFSLRKGWQLPPVLDKSANYFCDTALRVWQYFLAVLHKMWYDIIDNMQQWDIMRIVVYETF